MKKTISCLILVAALAACAAEDETPTTYDSEDLRKSELRVAANWWNQHGQNLQEEEDGEIITKFVFNLNGKVAEQVGTTIFYSASFIQSGSNMRNMIIAHEMGHILGFGMENVKLSWLLQQVV